MKVTKWDSGKLVHKTSSENCVLREKEDDMEAAASQSRGEVDSYLPVEVED